MSHVVENVIVAKSSDKLTEPELDAVVTAFNTLDYRPQVSVGTESGPGTPAFGEITALRRVGNRLLATVETAHESVARALRSGAKLTASVYHNLRRAGAHYARALRAVSLPDVPAPELKLVPSGVMEFASADYSRVVSYELDSRDSPGAEVDELVRAYMEEAGTTSYSEALDAVLSENPDLYHEYANWSTSVSLPDQDAQRLRNAQGLSDPRAAAGPGEQIQKLVAAEIAKNPTLTNTQALKRVCGAHPDLAEEYSRHPTSAMSRDAIMGSGGPGR